MEIIKSLLNKYIPKHDYLYAYYFNNTNLRNDDASYSTNMNEDLYYNENMAVIEFIDNNIHLTLLNGYHIFNSYDTYNTYINELDILFNGILFLFGENDINIGYIITPFKNKEYNTTDLILFYHVGGDYNIIVSNYKYLETEDKNNLFGAMCYPIEEWFKTEKERSEWVIEYFPMLKILNRNEKICNLLQNE